MTKRIIFGLLIFAISLNYASAQDAGRLAGNWLATLEFNGMKFRLVVKVEKSGDGYVGKLNAVDQAAKDLPVETVSLNGRAVTFLAPAIGISYEGTLNEKGDSIAGTFRQRGAQTQLVFARIVDIPTISRRQDPKKPYPYEEFDVTYSNKLDNVKLAATLTIPGDRTKKYPAVILISGSGSQDRNETVAGHRPFLVLADHLTRNGIAVLRYDDRGVGGSDPGDLNATSENYMHDVLAGVDFLKTRSEIDIKKIGLIGHSEGGMIAPMAAVRSKDIAFIVMLAGLGQKGEDVMYTQIELLERASGTDPAAIVAGVKLLREINSIVKSETDGSRIEERVNAVIAKNRSTMNESQQKSFASIESSIMAFKSVYKSSWYRYFILFDPAPVLKNVKVPVLAINGELDLQVESKQNLGLIAGALKAGGNKDFTVRSFPKLNHLFQTGRTGLVSEYMTIEETISPNVLQAVTEWIAERTAKSK